MPGTRILLNERSVTNLNIVLYLLSKKQTHRQIVRIQRVFRRIPVAWFVYMTRTNLIRNNWASDLKAYLVAQGWFECLSHSKVSQAYLPYIRAEFFIISQLLLFLVISKRFCCCGNDRTAIERRVEAMCTTTNIAQRINHSAALG